MYIDLLITTQYVICNMYHVSSKKTKPCHAKQHYFLEHNKGTYIQNYDQ